jgi:hypothetical protein
MADFCNVVVFSAFFFVVVFFGFELSFFSFFGIAFLLPSSLALMLLLLLLCDTSCFCDGFFNVADRSPSPPVDSTGPTFGGDAGFGGAGGFTTLCGYGRLAFFFGLGGGTFSPVPNFSIFKKYFCACERI